MGRCYDRGMRRGWIVALGWPIAACSLLTPLDDFTSSSSRPDPGDAASAGDASAGDAPGVVSDGGTDAVADSGGFDADGGTALSYTFENGCSPFKSDNASATASSSSIGRTGAACQLCATAVAGERRLEAETALPAGTYLLSAYLKPSVVDKPPTAFVRFEIDYGGTTSEPMKMDSLDTNWKKLFIIGAVEAGADRVKIAIGSDSMVAGDCLLVDDVVLVRQ